MDNLTSAGGSLSAMVLGLGGLGLLVTLGLAGVALMKRRVPLTLLVLLPLAITAIGAVGAWMNAGTALSAISGVEPDMIVATSTAGLYDALAADWFSRWVSAYVFGAGAWAAALGAFFAGPDARFTPVASAAAALLSVIAAAVVAFYSVRYGIGGGTLLIALILFSGMGVAFGALKRAQYEHAHRVAGMRFASAICMLLGVSYGGRALLMGSRMDTFGPDGIASTGATLVQAIGMWNEVAAPVVTLAWVSFAFAVLIAFAGFYYELGEVVERFTLLDVTLTLLLMGGLSAVRVVEGVQVDTLAGVATNMPAAMLYADIGGDLPAALLSIDKNVQGVRPLNGGFGDVLQFGIEKDAETGDEIGEKKWTRIWEWSGSSWSADDTPLAEVSNLSSLRPLLVIEGGEDATTVMPVLEQAGGKALLLMRAEEVKSDVDVPPELAYLQVTFMPLELSKERDYTTEVWAMAGAKQLNWGPTTWFGEEEGEEPIVYVQAVLDNTEAAGVNALVGERSRVKGVVATCLPTITKKEGEGTAPSGRWCHLGEGELEEVRIEVMELVEAPVPEKFRARWGQATDLINESVGQDFIVDRISREFGAMDYCLGLAVDEGEEVNGVMHAVVGFTRKGSVFADLHERSKNTNDAALRCLKDRLKKVKFEGERELDEDGKKMKVELWPDLPEPEEGEEPEPIEPEIIDLILDIRV